SILVHLVDLSAGAEPSKEAEVVARELELYSKELARKPRLVVGSKLDAAHEGAADDLERWAAGRGWDCHRISAVAGTGVKELIRKLAAAVREGRRREVGAGHA
ncbi:MAG TPA: GTPase ObgE, partial [Thermoanaerobaculia bacterium]|nr:GTPase ObgE [Thermoanaerobaculia bacterium]